MGRLLNSLRSKLSPNLSLTSGPGASPRKRPSSPTNCRPYSYPLKRKLPIRSFVNPRFSIDRGGRFPLRKSSHQRKDTMTNCLAAANQRLLEIHLPLPERWDPKFLDLLPCLWEPLKRIRLYLWNRR